jgi:hypothetical protein
VFGDAETVAVFDESLAELETHPAACFLIVEIPVLTVGEAHIEVMIFFYNKLLDDFLTLILFFL